MPFKTDTQTTDSLFQTLLATAVDGIIVIDARGTVRVYNDACERLFGYPADAVVGRNVSMLMPAPYREEHDGYLRHYARTGERRIIGIGREVLGARKDGSTFPMLLSVGEGTVKGEKIYVGIIHDLTSKEGTRKRLEQLQMELLHVSRLSDMAQMVAGLAHELNQPLTATMNYVKAARRVMAGVEAPQVTKAQELIDKAAEQTARAGKIIRHLRDFIEKRETVRSREDVSDVTREAVALAQTAVSDPSVTLHCDLMSALPQVLIDKVQIQQVVINLMRNSVEAMQAVARRELTVCTRMREADGMIEVAVADTGPGLTPEVAARLFQPFVTTKEKGMGIGLTICQSIVESHNGRIWAEARESDGVTFRFTLPAAAALE
jgi:two-component system sensor kinase FixL